MSALARPAWLAFATFAALIAAAVLARWVWAVTLGGPILYGEGAVAHAALLARDGAEYAPFVAPVFVAANYTPLFFHVVSLGDPFVWGRAVSIGCALFVAAAIAWRARPAGMVVSAGLGSACLGLVPVALWGPAVKPDLLATALTVAAVVALDPLRTLFARRSSSDTYVIEPGTITLEPRAALAGVLIALAIAAKPTAALPAMALGIWLVRSGRPRSFGAFAAAGLAAGAVLLVITPGGVPALMRHVVAHNALPWSLERAALLALIAFVLLVVPIALALRQLAPVAFLSGGRLRGHVTDLETLTRVTSGMTDGSPPAVVSREYGGGASLAYLAGAAGIVLLGGREGATVNYLIDLSAAGMLALAGVVPGFTGKAAVPALLAGQLAIGLVLLDPLGLSARQGTGAWLDPQRIAAARALPEGPILAEDSGLLVMEGREPIVDDLFLWSRLVERGAIDPKPLLDLVTSGTLVRIVADHDLERIGDAPAWARERWHQPLVEAVLARYRLAERNGGLFIYAPR